MDKLDIIIELLEKLVLNKNNVSDICNDNFRDYLDFWFQTYKVPYNGKFSLRDISHYLKIINEFFGNEKLSSISGEKIQLLLNKYSNFPNTQKKLYQVLNGSLEKAFQLCKINRNPCGTAVLTPFVSAKRRAFEFEEQSKIVSSIDNEKYKNLFLFLCCTGIRIGRALTLTNENIDYQTNIIKVFKKQKKGLTAEYFVPCLTEYFHFGKKKLFAGITYKRARTYFSELFKKLNIKDVTLYSCRHTFVSILYFLNVKEKQIQLWAGHNTLDMTLNVYTHLLNKGNSPILDYLKIMVKNYSK